MPRKLKRIKGLNVTFVSLLKRGANLQPGLLKGENGVEIQCLTKADVEGLLHSIVYLPNKPDAHGHLMLKEDVRQACHTHNANGARLDHHHDLKPLSKEQAHMVESFVLQGPDPRFPTEDRDGNPISHAGAWGMITKIEDPELLAKAKNGDLTEVSLFAPAGGFELEDYEAETVSKEEPKEPDMDPEELAKAIANALKPQFEALQKSIDEAKPEPPKTENKTQAPVLTKNEDGSPVFPDSDDPKALLKYERELEDWTLKEEYKERMADIDSVKEYRQRLTDLRKERDEQDIELGYKRKPGASLRKASDVSSRSSQGGLDYDPIKESINVAKALHNKSVAGTAFEHTSYKDVK